MPTVHYYGKKTNFVGKTLFQILANLRDFGVNRMVLKQEELLSNPGKRCYYIVKKVEPVMDDNLDQGAIYAERIYRNAKVPGLVFIDDETWHSDWQLVPRHEEHRYRIDEANLIEHGQPGTVEVLPRWMQVPPLMDVFLRRHYRARGNVQVAPVRTDKIPLSIRMHYEFNRMNKPHQMFRIAEEDEKSESNINMPVQTLLMEQFRPGKTKPHPQRPKEDGVQASD